MGATSATQRLGADVRRHIDVVKVQKVAETLHDGRLVPARGKVEHPLPRDPLRAVRDDARDLPDPAREPRPIERVEQGALRRRHQDGGAEHVRLVEPEEVAFGDVREDVPGAANGHRPPGRRAREVHLGEDLLGQPVMGAGRCRTP